MNRRIVTFGLVLLFAVTANGRPVLADDAKADDAKAFDQMVSRGIDYLRGTQAEDGSWSAQAGPGITALITTGLLRQGRSADEPIVAKALKYIESFQQTDGGVYKTGSRLKNYETCLAVVCFSAANKGGRYDKVLTAAQKYLHGEQWDEHRDKDTANFDYGGAGYGSNSRPDLSNTQFFMEALKATGDEKSSEAMKKALVFISRCQNLETEHNTAPPAAKNPDGGFYYTVAGGGASPAGKTDEGALRSYGSMTYAGLKSLIFAGVKRDDPRVKAAVKWLQNNYTLDANPGLGESGLYYYYHTFAKSLDALGEDTFTDADGKQHAWRQELTAALAKRQQNNGSWVNKNPQWLEGDANMVTGFALLSLSYCK